MKQATGELNMTVIIVIAVGILAAFFYFTIWPMISNNFKHNSKCSDAVCECNDSESYCIKHGATCHLPNEKGAGSTFTCPWKG